ncbi:hypothetical protein [Kushneria phosphatilytica]|uniref:Uncharacterized protein n=1 Tax=Kushneria phosphatilytica TaxID=657387 RepID=A0A1S1NX27_9GAMM|nr:hypothetical protein [Kushneria phosphatilytica]OHV11926.1 hypothetical protein BH688_04415 [Kushneria phosphatilytica]QEL11108.1 hypothetical protein FY550_08165 [Kushneria phosphatilytica]
MMQENRQQKLPDTLSVLVRLLLHDRHRVARTFLYDGQLFRLEIERITDPGAAQRAIRDSLPDDRQ